VIEPYYEHAGVTIYHGDCLDILPELDTFDVGFADPPYNYGFDYGPGCNDKRAPVEYAGWCGRWFDMLRAQAERIYVTPGYGNLYQWLGRAPNGMACWYKPGNPSGAGIFQFCEWEPVLVWGKGRIGGSDVWKATINPTFKGKLGHPCPKPLLLLERILTTSKGTSVVDPFVGSGTTLVVAKKLGMRAVGIEQNEAYCELAAKRCGQEVLDLGGAA
jgi:DNA modification methylase